MSIAVQGRGTNFSAWVVQVGPNEIDRLSPLELQELYNFLKLLIQSLSTELLIFCQEIGFLLRVELPQGFLHGIPHFIYCFQNLLRFKMIRFILLQNRRGRTRLSKWFINYDENEKIRLQSEIHRMIVGRDSKQTDFIEFHNFKIVYKRYQGLYFAVCIDINDNELLHLQLIHLFVENLDHYFGNVCELDIVFNFHKVYGILDQIIVGGEVLETAKDIIVNSLKNLEVED